MDKEHKCVHGKSQLKNWEDFCKDSNSGTFRNLAEENISTNHAPRDLNSEFKALKLKIRNWKDRLHDLKTLTSSKIKSVKRIKTKNAYSVYNMRDNLVTGLNKEFEEHIGYQKRIISKINVAKENGTNFAKWRDNQEALLDEMEELVFSKESYDKLKEFIISIEKRKFKDESKSKEKAYNEEICEYLVASEARKKEHEVRILQDLGVKNRYLFLQSLCKSELRRELKALIKSVFRDDLDSSD